MKSYKKSTFHKLYLIEPELYNKILPLLNELDKNELLQLNQRHSEEDELLPLNQRPSEEETGEDETSIAFIEDRALNIDNLAIRVRHHKNLLLNNAI